MSYYRKKKDDQENEKKSFGVSVQNNPARVHVKHLTQSDKEGKYWTGVAGRKWDEKFFLH